MARNRKERTTKKPAAATKDRRRRGRPKFCVFCAEGAVWVDYKDIGLLRRFVNDRGRIRPRGATGTCAQHQRDVASAIKTARELALLPYAVRVLANDKAGRRGGGRDARPPRADAAADGAAPDESAADDLGVDDSDLDVLVTSGSGDAAL
jgi:small subunit ribosomal protein S18